MVTFLSFYINVGCPTLVRSDHGTENGQVATAQIAFRLDHQDQFAADKSFIYGTSPCNIVRPIICN